ncbi:porin [Butyricimonas sp.]|uniref:porin n=1 Tax=Butyricimonas sp. TaxID=1969738 RepID=UPI0025C54102|nr:porin [Butyricimonas sp.]
MKKLAILIVVMGFGASAFAQSSPKEKTLFERVSNVEKKIDWFNFYLNMQGSFDASFNYDRNGLSEAAFKMRQFRIEAKGNITPWLSYRWRQRLNRGNNGSGTIDNMPTSIDIAGIGVKLNDQFSFFAGKQCAAYGGIEFDLNPIEIYEYSDMIENMSNFMTGLNIAYQVDDNHQIQFQILDSRNNSFEDTYGKNLEDGRAPLLYTINWNGSLFDGFYKTRWSASIMSEAKDKQMYYYALGNDFTFSKKVNAFVDFMYSDEDIDRKGIMTGIVGLENEHNAFNAKYMSLVAKVNYRFLPKWNVFMKGMYETASIFKATENVEKGKYRTSYGYLAGVEFYPMESNLHFFCTFVGRSYNFTDRAKVLGQNNYNTQRVEVGFIYQLPMF